MTLSDQRIVHKNDSRFHATEPALRNAMKAVATGVASKTRIGGEGDRP